MATSAMARETVLSLRRTIARLEGRPPEQLEVRLPGEPPPAGRSPGVRPPQDQAPQDRPSAADRTILRRGSEAALAAAREVAAAAGGGAGDPPPGGLATGGLGSGVLATGADRLDAALRGGLPLAALTEIVSGDPRDAGAGTGFVLALAIRARRLRRADETHPFLWIGAGPAYAEAGLPYAPGLAALAGWSPRELLVAGAPRLTDALWIAEEAARLAALCAVVLEVRGNPARLDLTASRRLHRRAVLAGRPVFLLRQSARAEPTAAPWRLHVSAAPAAPRATLAGPLDGSIGRPAFAVAIGKGRSPLSGPFILEWNSDAHRFSERTTQDPGAVVPAFGGRPHPAPAAGTVVALKAAS